MEADAPADGLGEASPEEEPSGYLKTILTYSRPSEAEVDKAFLESHGIAVCLLNANTSRNELGAPFFVRLQVMEGDVRRACRLIGEVNPSRFGSSERVSEIDREIKRSIAWFLLIALPIGIGMGFVVYLLSAGMAAPGPMDVKRNWVTPDVRLELSVAAGLAASVLAAAWNGRRR